MARVRARITGRKPALPSPLEQAAEEWQAQQEQGERRPFEPGGQTSVVTLQRMPLEARADGSRTDVEIGWRTCQARVEHQPRRVVPNGAMMGRIVQTLRAREWARATGRKTRAPLESDLEAWAERWKRAEPVKAKGAAGSAGSKNSRGRS
ncbi:MAG: hypothetical protein Q7R32_12610 [Dehalococcoidia bacterium]|nr:hypothetical protein [Dehalococcoidia bacterium]